MGVNKKGVDIINKMIVVGNTVPSEHTAGRIFDIEGNCPTICTTLFDLNIIKDHKTYRKLTINECEKLQGVPRGYTSIVSKNDARKLLGNGWNVDTIVHILNGYKKYINNKKYKGV